MAKTSPIIILISLLTILDATAQESEDETPEKLGGLLPVPALFFTPETGVGGGLGVLYSYREYAEDRPNTVLPIAIYTERKQSIYKLFLDLYPSRGAYYVEAELGYTNYPDRFFGIGSDNSIDSREDFTERYSVFSTNLHRRIGANNYVGLHLLAEEASVLDKDEGKSLSAAGPAKIVGSDGGRIIATGLRLLQDTRDNLFTPRNGRRVSLLWQSSRFGLGSEFSYDQLRGRYREYIPIGERTTLAVEGQIVLGDGEIPFRKLALLGGQYLLRGYFLGRFRDRNLWATQVGLRHYRGNVGYVGFAGVGSVAENPGQLFANQVISSFGAGLRYIVVPSTGAGFRLDYAVGKDESAVYFGVSEAF